MAHYAKLDENNNVIGVIVIANKDCLDENGNECEEPGRRMCELLTGHKKWKKTSYNTRLGVHYDSNTGQPSEDQSKALRLNYARIGMRYDEVLDGFIPPENDVTKRNPKLVINPKTGWWGFPKPSIPRPEDLQLDLYSLEEYQEPWVWNEHKYEWVKIKKNEASPHFFFYEEMF